MGPIVELLRSIVSFITSTQPSWVRIWNIDMKASGNVSNLLNSKLQNSCIELELVISSKHMVNMISEPSFFPGPKIL